MRRWYLLVLLLSHRISALSEESIVRRTQRCTEDCKDEPSELVQMCIQRCTYYMINPYAHSISHEPRSSTDRNGMLVENEHVRTRVRLIGPDGLPLVASTNAVAAPASTSEQSTEDVWAPEYRIELVNGARLPVCNLFAVMFLVLVF